jgi:urate oxidase
MAVKLGENNYGKSRVRLLRVLRQEGRHDIKELTVGIRFEGDFEAAHTKGENKKILPSDTIKNTVYALARQYPVEAVEDFALHLIEHFLTYNEQVSRVGLRRWKIRGPAFRTERSRMLPHSRARQVRKSARQCWTELVKELRFARVSRTWMC